MEDSDLYSNSLFLALTRPTLMMGVPMEAFFINIIISLCAFILAKNLFFALIWVPLHVLGVILCRMDSQLFAIVLANTRLVKANNYHLWQGCSYEPF